jgi:hypothetical protein
LTLACEGARWATMVTKQVKNGNGAERRTFLCQTEVRPYAECIDLKKGDNRLIEVEL